MEPKRIEDMFVGFDTVLEIIYPVAIILSVVFIIIGGYMWISSAGNPDKVKQAQGTLTWAIIGLIFIFLTNLLLQNLVDYIFGM